MGPIIIILVILFLVSRNNKKHRYNRYFPANPTGRKPVMTAVSFLIGK